MRTRDWEQKRIARLQAFPPCRLVCPEPPEFTHQRVRQEDVARAATLGDLGSDSEAVPRPTLGRVDIPDAETYSLRQP
jgi:hypothetical protein